MVVSEQVSPLILVASLSRSPVPRQFNIAGLAGLLMPNLLALRLELQSVLDLHSARRSYIVPNAVLCRMATKVVNEFLNARLQAGHNCERTILYKQLLLDQARLRLERDVTWSELCSPNSKWRQKNGLRQDRPGNISDAIIPSPLTW